MKNFLEIINNEQKDNKIKQLAEKFGFTNVRIYVEKDSDAIEPLYVLVSNLDPKKDGYDSAFEAYLIQELSCKVIIYVESKLKDLYKISILKNSTNIDDQTSLLHLFKKPLNEVQLRDVEKDGSFTNHQKRALGLAKRILNDNPNTDFFPSKKLNDKYSADGSSAPSSDSAQMYQTTPPSLKNQA